MKELKSIVDHVSYELAKDMVSNKKHPIAAKYLFEQLSSEHSTNGKFSYPDAQYSYAVALFRDELTEEEKEQKIYNLLSKADGCEHQEARLFLGLLLFTKGYEFCRSSNYWNYLESYINVTLDDKDMKQKYLKEKVSIFIAHEYINRSNTYIQYNEEKAKNILKSNSDKSELKRLEKAIEKLQQGSGNLLKDVKKVLKKVQPKLLEKFYSECSDVKPELATWGQLPEKLGASGIIIKKQENSKLSTILEELKKDDISFNTEGILQLQQLCFILEQEVKSGLEPSDLQEEILEMLKNLRAVSVHVQLQYFGDSSILCTNRQMDARRPSNFETSHMKRTSNIPRSSSASLFASPSTPLPTRLSRVRIRSNSSPEIPLPQANSTAFDNDVFSNVDDITPKFYCVDLFTHLKPEDCKHQGEDFNKAAVLCESGFYYEALKIYEKVLQERKILSGYELFSTVMVAHNVAVLSYALGAGNRSLEVFNEMLKELGNDSPHTEVIKSNIKIVEDGSRRVSFTKPSQELEQGRSSSSGSNSQSMLAIDKYKESYSAGSSTSGFGSTIGTFSDRQSTDEESGAASLDSKSSKVSSRTKLKQSLSSLQRNVSKTSVSSKSVGRSSQSLFIIF